MGVIVVSPRNIHFSQRHTTALKGVGLFIGVEPLIELEILIHGDLEGLPGIGVVQPNIVEVQT